jgi:sarcosine oxidase
MSRNVNKWDLIVVGAGAVGSAALRAASERGARVLGLEQYTPANTRGSSHGQSRAFSAMRTSSTRTTVRCCAIRRRDSSRWSGRSGARLLHRCGMLVMGSTGSAAVLGYACRGTTLGAARRGTGRPPRIAGAVSLVSRMPLDAIAAFEADAGIVRPEAAVHAAILVSRRHARQNCALRPMCTA